jgi:IMP dehydrogenase
MFPDATIMSGNVCSYNGAFRLADSGVDSIRVGVGSGAMCITRQVTGHGVPQLSAIEECAAIKDLSGKCFPDVAIISDGGIRKSGDIVKSLAIGADAVMVGSLLAGTTETPGEYIEEEGRLFKYYSGMASSEAREKWFDKSKVGLPIEGVSKKVPYLGRSAKRIVNDLCQSVKVGLSYSGAKNIQELREKAMWRKVTNAGYIEGTPHGK